MQSIWFFNDVNLFKVLCPHKLKEYKECHTFNLYNKNDYIYFEEDAANKVYLIDKGKVKLGYNNEDGSEVIMAILGKGELFGEKAILGENKRTEFAQAIDKSTSICPIGVDTMHELMRDNQTFTLKVYKFIGFKFKKLERRLQLLLFKDTKTRLVEFINELCSDYGYDCEKTGNQIIRHPYSQKDIASLIGTSRPTLNILMNELKNENFIDFNRKEIKILKKSA
ncbi:MAG: transcriptional regulator [Flavobacteriaceae bacterium]|uniref:Crp/Fnr family transcriptional regulator n=1 Tax=Winogradskyella sp. SYSU M77433 TaxID=3042722 RepID=UPI000C4600E8|nr:Crp/Fnr family transcriptional regulator [Winogradskyella sp. SYSU M77433]MAX69790.1 transcriptional regulator [Flavobacteriaceae bacterium]MDH7914401.1 Crp/Fnr family transcriptional regulator [Winogradskyella sp. SYSU M77433]|tara:strand:- start:213 stop:884 length:672 start_codon:yes stop_codon:yes gene_type:complete